jgi:hypothetical protein
LDGTGFAVNQDSHARDAAVTFARYLQMQTAPRVGRYACLRVDGSE